MSKTTKKRRVLSQEEFLDKMGKKSGTTKTTIRTNLNRFNLWTTRVHNSTVQDWVRSMSRIVDETDDPQIVYDELQKYFDWCMTVPDPPAYYSCGRIKKDGTYQQRQWGKISPNTVNDQVWYILKYFKRVGGLEFDKEEFFEEVDMPDNIAFDTEEAEPLTTEMAQLLFGEAPKTGSIRVFYRISNDTGFRLMECYLLQEKNVFLDGDRPYVHLEQHKSKGRSTSGNRRIFPPTVKMIREMLTGDPENYFMMEPNHCRIMQDPTSSVDEIAKVKHTIRSNVENTMVKSRRALFKKTGDGIWMEKYERRNRYKINNHSWRIRAGSKYADVNGADLSHGFLRHNKYLPQYMLKSDEERESMIVNTQPFLEFDMLEIKTFEIKRKDEQITELEVKDRKIARLENKVDSLTKNQFDEKDVMELIDKVIKKKSQTDHSDQFLNS